MGAPTMDLRAAASAGLDEGARAAGATRVAPEAVADVAEAAPAGREVPPRPADSPLPPSASSSLSSASCEAEAAGALDDRSMMSWMIFSGFTLAIKGC